MTTHTREIATERRNPRTAHIDALSTLEMARLMNSEDKRVAEAVEAVCPQIARAIDLIAERLRAGGRLVYCGSGTSGRLGILDAVECPPTFSTDPDRVIGLIAGGPGAVFRAVEGAEDDRPRGEADLRGISFSKKDMLAGLSASGRTPYVLGAMAYARGLGAAVIAVTCCPGSEMDLLADIGIAPEPGPEVIAGSTRLKSGTAEKLVLNMLSTGAMIRLGKVYGNLMVDVRPGNEKLRRRCVRIVREATDADEPAARKALDACGWRCKPAIVHLLTGLSPADAEALLASHEGRVAPALARVGGGES